MKIGVISDTHNVFDRRIPEIFKGVDHILHAGDIGMAWVVLELEQIAPVTAVAGNTDGPGRFRATESVELDGRRFVVHHVVNPHAPSPELQKLLLRHPPDVLVYGHTHLAAATLIGRTLFFNPGSAGPSRGGNPRTVGLLHLDAAGARPEIIEL